MICLLPLFCICCAVLQLDNFFFQSEWEFFYYELFIFLSGVYIVRSILVVNFDLFHKALDGF
ncbi:hypothetical protein EA601_15735 [Salmonella enterica]|uniref:Uncharacterized protein n=1 Tax=Salmonella enterica subsp. enterica serovar Weltevreden TaxID=57743 RepID=A0A5X6N9N1_SALET|nr:hypothetical protein [Salmonella enterica subsp. enterica serovar Weltevreden]EAA9352512.1 hypothetical protein [Salmonella enterica subsp. enterica]EAB1764471.1 hypothetical protein [Salmonella enterica]EAA7895939.1 hypothetical protein [Salmonella enterica subsp. enterica serovar Weltevreden]EAB7846627.1 hypothetical protein [Salmonella enterica subsp. enterica serovar Weltevreden]